MVQFLTFCLLYSVCVEGVHTWFLTSMLPRDCPTQSGQKNGWTEDNSWWQYKEGLFPWVSIAAKLFWKLGTTYLFIIFAHQIATFVIKLPQGTNTKYESVVKVCKTEQQQLSAHIKISAAECLLEKYVMYACWTKSRISMESIQWGQIKSRKTEKLSSIYVATVSQLAQLRKSCREKYSYPVSKMLCTP